ncbi:hypothetical protein LSM04_006999 [Trypanosoma melophagium]|uniref:uncharacterized protein n=1 Tax=Trypanosoma melophagium TaxID=715481 RepID=UPI003519FEB9|nr:hypothetical protein LSM04_006999 [Trypanosoma melophagium]
MAASPASHSAAITALDEAEGRAIIVLVLGELATYLCRAGEPRPFLEEKAIPEDFLGCTTSSTASTSSTAKTASKQEAASRIISKLREHILDRNIIMVFPIHSSQEYREKLLLFVFEKLQVRTVIAISDLVADAFALGPRESLVLHASLSKLSIGRVEAGVTVKYTTSTAGSLSQIVKPTACNGNCNHNVDGKEMKTDGVRSTENGDTGSLTNTTADTNSNCTLGVGGDRALSLRSFSSTTVDLLDEKYREKLLSFFGDVVYQSVVSLQEKQQGHHNSIRLKRGRTDEKHEDNGEEEEENKVVGKENNWNTVPATTSRNKRRGVLERLISSVSDGDSLPVIITGEALNIAPLLRDFLEETIRICSNAHKEDSDSSSSSLEDSDSTIGSSSSISTTTTTTTTNNNNNNSDSSSSSSSSAYACGLLKLQPLPLPGFSWMLSVIGGSLVAQLSLAELSKLRISREDAISSKGSIIHWRSVV